MAQGAKELFVTLMIQHVDCKFYVFFFLLFLRPTAVIRCREVI